jgi:hypothetical protein
MSAERKYHLAGTAYCDCERGVDHEGDAEADAAWDEDGWVGLEQLYVRRNRDEINRLRAELEATQARAKQLSYLLRGMARRSVRLRSRLSATFKACSATRSEQRYREALVELVELHWASVYRTDDRLAAWDRARAALAEEDQR